MTDFYTPEQDKPGLQSSPAVRHELPNVLIIGDSISIGYTQPVATLLHNICNLRRAQYE